MSDKKKQGGLLGPAIFCGASILALYGILQIPSIGPEAKSVQTDKCGTEITAYVMAQAPVRSLLKAPASAEFPSYSSPNVQSVRTAECAFSVAGYVDAQNGFGAQIRTPFRVTMVTDGRSWSASDVKVGD